MVRSTRGIALISVLWITGLLAVVAASFVSGARTETRLAYNQMENAKAEALADGGVQRAALGLLDPDPETAWHADRTVHSFALGEGDVQVRIEDEDGKIDLNVASIELLDGLFRAAGLDDDQAQTMAARIIDFRDGDDDPEPLGAERPAYLEAGLDHGPDNRPFATESELVRVLGMTQSVYEQVRPCVTVYSGADAIDPTQAPRLVLEALPGITPPVVEALLTVGSEVDPLSVIEDQPGFAGLEEYLLPSRDLLYTIRAVGRTSGGGRFVRRALIELGAGGDPPFLVHAWSRGTLPDPAG